MKSLFTGIPLQLALDCTENDIKNSTVELPLPTDDIMDPLNLCLTSTLFQYHDKHCKQLHGTAMSFPVSIVLAEIVMPNIEEQALATYTRTIPLWLRYVDDKFTAVHKDGIDDFRKHLNRHNVDIQLQDQSSQNPTYHKATSFRTLTRRAQLVCDSPDSLQDETDYLNNVFSNNYNTDFDRRNTHSNNQ